MWKRPGALLLSCDNCSKQLDAWRWDPILPQHHSALDSDVDPQYDLKTERGQTLQQGPDTIHKQSQQ